MGSCSPKKFQIHNSLTKHSQFTQDQHFQGMSWIDKYIQQPQERIILPYNPNSSEYQYNVEVEGVIFDVIAPPDFLDEDNLEPIENEE